MFGHHPRRHLMAVTLSVATVLAMPSLAQQARRPATATPPATDNELLATFRDPPKVARPHVWWHWMSGNVTPEGARLDLEWLSRMGIGGVHAFAGGTLEPAFVPEPLPFMSERWAAVYKASVQQAHAAGMDVAIAGSPGWSQTGGPWVPPAQGMKKLTWAVTEIEGDGRRGVGALVQPPGATGPFQAVSRETNHFAASTTAITPQAHGIAAVIAFPAVERARAPARYRSQAGDLTGLSDAPADLSRAVALPIAAKGDTFIDVDLGTATTIHAVTVAVSPMPALELMASDDGRTFRSLRRIAQEDVEKPSAQRTVAIDPTRARFIRVRFDQPQPWRVLPDLPPYIPAAALTKELTLRLLRVETGPRVDDFEAKAGFQPIVTPDASAPAGTRGINSRDVIDLTDRVRGDGSIAWTPPKGRWTVVRFGWSLTGQTNGPAEPSATGLEVDKLDAGAVRSYVDNLFALYRDKAGVSLGKDGIGSLLTDSWEAGVQNWTPAMLAAFKRLRGYDPTPWLPTLAGYVVGDARQSDAFLFDYRQTLKDLVVANHYQVLADAAHRQGMRYYTEAQGDTPRAISDGFAAKARADVPTAEYWYRPFATDPGQPSLVADLKEAASAAHVYGKPLVAAEALTVAAGKDPWAFSPAMLKPVADRIFANGVNRMLIHDSHLQPFAARKPGLMLGFFGQFFNRNDTWAERARPWVDYLARTSWLLQQGRYVADVAYFYGEEQNLTQRFARRQNNEVPSGYGFDYVNAEALLNKLSVRDGRLVTDTGMSYRMLYIPPDVTRMTLPVLRKIDALVRAGGMIVAPKVQATLGLKENDAERARLSDALWGENEGPRRTVGKGMVYSGTTLAKALIEQGVSPDVVVPAGVDVLSLHRSLPGADIYFISHQGSRQVSPALTFRVVGLVPEWWSADTGTTRPLGYRRVGAATQVDVPLEPQEAGFVVFRKPAPGRDRMTATAPVTIRQDQVLGAWQVSFQPGRGAPASATFDRLIDWSKHSDPGIRYFSGTATYRHSVTLPARPRTGERVMLDLGEVHDLATVSVNGREIRTLWHSPFRVDITDAVRSGSNDVRVEVINLWPNRLIGDKQPGATPVTYAPQSPYVAASPLLQSGLIGPVRIDTER